MSRFSTTTGPKLQPIRIATVWSSTFSEGCGGDLFLHLRSGVQRIVGRGKGRHDLIAHGFDHGAVVLLGGRAHDLDADADHIARAKITQLFIQLGAAERASSVSPLKVGFLRNPLHVQVVLALCVLIGNVRGRSVHIQGVHAGHPREVVGGAQQRRIFAGPVEVFDLHGGVARIGAPGVAHVGAAAVAAGGADGGERARHRKERRAVPQLGLEAGLLGVEGFAGEQILAGAVLVRVLRAETQAHAARERNDVFQFGVRDVDDVFAVVFDRAERDCPAFRLAPAT